MVSAMGKRRRARQHEGQPKPSATGDERRTFFGEVEKGWQRLAVRQASPGVPQLVEHRVGHRLRATAGHTSERRANTNRHEQLAALRPCAWQAAGTLQHP